MLAFPPDWTGSAWLQIPEKKLRYPSQSWISQYKCFGVNVLQMLQKDIDALKIIHYLTEIQT